MHLAVNHLNFKSVKFTENFFDLVPLLFQTVVTYLMILNFN